MKLLIILSLLVSCASDEIGCDKEPDAIIENICIYKNGLDVKNQDLRKSLNVIHSVWSEKFDVDVFDIAQKHQDLDFNSQIEIVNFIEEYEGYLEYFSIFLTHRECIANTAIGHEMLHLLAERYDLDFSHKNVALFLQPELEYFQVKNSLENIINVKLCAMFCEEDCVWYRIK